MKHQKKIGSSIAAIMALSLCLTGCGNVAGETESIYEKETNSTPSALLTAVSGTYEELFPVLFEEKYEDIWTESCAASVGEDGAAAAVEMLQGFMSGTVIGQEAVDTYASDPDNAMFDCDFTNDVETFTFDGTKISGKNPEGKEVFAHNYSYVGYDEELDFYEFQSDEKDSGEFTYFILRGDTPFSTYHIEFRYGSDLDALLNYYEGDYAYWMAAGIIQDCDDEMIQKCIDLFCTENLESDAS